MTFELMSFIFPFLKGNVMSEEAKAGSARELRSPDLDALLNSSLDTFLPLDSTAAAPPKDSEPAAGAMAPPRTETAEGGPPQEKAGGKISGAVLATVCQRCNNSLMHLYADSDPSQVCCSVTTLNHHSSLLPSRASN